MPPLKIVLKTILLLLLLDEVKEVVDFSGRHGEVEMYATELLSLIVVGGVVLEELAPTLQSPTCYA